MSSTTFLIKKQHRLYDPWSSPLGILYRAIENACKKGEAKDPAWYPLREQGMNKGKALRGPSELYLMQGVLLKHDKTEYGGPKGPPLGWGKNPTLVFMLSKDAGKHLVDLLNKENEGYSGAPDDWEARYVAGDPVSPLSGRFLHFWEKGTDPKGRYRSQPTEQPQQSGGSAFDDMDTELSASQGGANRQMEAKGFEVEITTVHNNRTANFNDAGMQQIRDHWQDWDDILYTPTEIEQAHLLADCFPASAIIYAFEPHNRDWIADKCWHALRNPTSVDFRHRPPEKAPEFPDDHMGGFGQPAPQTEPSAIPTAAPAAPPQAQRAQPASQASSGWEEDNGDGGAVDTAVPAAPETASSPVPVEAPPTAPQPPAAQDSAERTEERIARLAAARNKGKKK